jgi:hypothetical protein
MTAVGAAEAQLCNVVTGNFSQTADISMKSSNASCTVDDGGYIAINTVYKLHVAVTVTGWCQTYVTNGAGQCVASTLYDRTAINSWQYINGGTYGQYIVNGFNNVQNYTTCGNGNCTAYNSSGANSWFSSTLGAVRVYTTDNQTGGGTSGIGPQYCNMGMWFPENQPTTVNVLQCAPQFNIDNNQIIHFVQGSPGSPITTNVYVPPGLVGTDIDNAVIAAINSLNTDLTTSGVALQFARETVEANCTGAHCVKVRVINTGTDCALTASPHNTSTGDITSPVDLSISDAWTHTWYTNGFLTRSVTHELSHPLGLKENACTAANSIMGTFPSCGSSMSTTSQTTNDRVPMGHTTYGGGTRNSCGF